MTAGKRKVGRPRAKVKPIRMTVFVDDGTKSNIDSLALMYNTTASRIVALGIGALTRQIPEEDRELLAGIEQRRVQHQVSAGADMAAVERLMLDSILRQSKGKGRAVASPPAKPNVVQLEDPPVDEPEFEQS